MHRLIVASRLIINMPARPVLLMILASGWPAHVSYAVGVRGVSASPQCGRRPRGDDAQLLAPAANQTQCTGSHQGRLPAAGETQLI